MVRSEKALDVILATIKEALINHEFVVIRKFGRFKVQHKRKRIGLNPKTLEHHVVSARTVVKFTPGLALREIVNNGGLYEK